MLSKKQAVQKQRFLYSNLSDRQQRHAITRLFQLAAQFTRREFKDLIAQAVKDAGCS